MANEKSIDACLDFSSRFHWNPSLRSHHEKCRICHPSSQASRPVPLRCLCYTCHLVTLHKSILAPLHITFKSRTPTLESWNFLSNKKSRYISNEHARILKKEENQWNSIPKNSWQLQHTKHKNTRKNHVIPTCLTCPFFSYQPHNSNMAKRAVASK